MIFTFSAVIVLPSITAFSVSSTNDLAITGFFESNTTFERTGAASVNATVPVSAPSDTLFMKSL